MGVVLKHDGEWMSEWMSQFMRANGMTIWINGKSLGRSPLKGSSRAMKHLIRCMADRTKTARGSGDTFGDGDTFGNMPSAERDTF